jgi:hypothetical protein
MRHKSLCHQGIIFPDNSEYGIGVLSRIRLSSSYPIVKIQFLYGSKKVRLLTLICPLVEDMEFINCLTRGAYQCRMPVLTRYRIDRLATATKASFSIKTGIVGPVY